MQASLLIEKDPDDLRPSMVPAQDIFHAFIKQQVMKRVIRESRMTNETNLHKILDQVIDGVVIDIKNAADEIHYASRH